MYPCSLVLAVHLPTPPNTSPWAYTRAQRGGLLLLIVFVVACYATSRLLLPSTPIGLGEDDRQLVRLADSLRELTASAEAPPSDRSSQYASVPFNPNEVTSAELRRLGLSEKQATAFLRYRDKRPFRNADELLKLYVLRPEQADRLVALARIPQQSRDLQIASVPPVSPTPPPLRFPFDPNTVTEDSLRLLGLSGRQAKALVKYRSYGPQTFRRPADLRRLNALDSPLVDQLLPLVRIAPPAESAPPIASGGPPSEGLTPIDVNQATVDQWQQLPGIGPYRARQIVNFRDRLGGFASPEQVAETYGLPDSSYQRIRPLLRPGPIATLLYINRLDAEALGQHPYLDRRTAAIIVRYRDNHGPFASAAALENVRALTAESRTKLLPYLNFDR